MPKKKHNFGLTWRPWRRPLRANLEWVSLVSVGADTDRVVVVDVALGVYAAGAGRARVHALADGAAKGGEGADAVGAAVGVDHTL